MAWCAISKACSDQATAKGLHGKARKTAVPPKVAASPGYAISQRLRKRIEECFGWSKTVGGLAQLKLRGLDKVQGEWSLVTMAWNMKRLFALCPAQ